jgi:hypothetical protein
VQIGRTRPVADLLLRLVGQVNLLVESSVNAKGCGLSGTAANTGSD